MFRHFVHGSGQSNVNLQAADSDILGARTTKTDARAGRIDHGMRSRTLLQSRSVWMLGRPLLDAAGHYSNTSGSFPWFSAMQACKPQEEVTWI